MRTDIPESILATADGAEMANILRSCVHCGFCNATCPTYQIEGNELDGPRGRIYLIKSTLEGEQPSNQTQKHLDRCLTCRSCETTCPSGVQYGRLIELARPRIDLAVPRGVLDQLKRYAIAHIIPYPARFKALLALAGLVKPFLPSALAELVPQKSAKRHYREDRHQRRMLILEGCAQQVAAAEINNAAERVFARMGVSLCAKPAARCCGAVDYHLGNEKGAERSARMNIDTWWDEIDAGAQALLVPSSGCAVMIKQYPHLFQNDPDYLSKAERVAALVADPSEHIDLELLKKNYAHRSDRQIALQVPCTMQHGTHSDGAVRNCLQAIGYELAPVADSHLCCGSAGSYSLLQPQMSETLLANKLENLQARDPEVIASANIGCLMHLRRRANRRVVHWLELIDEASVE